MSRKAEAGRRHFEDHTPRCRGRGSRRRCAPRLGGGIGNRRKREPCVEKPSNIPGNMTEGGTGAEPFPAFDRPIFPGNFGWEGDHLGGWKEKRSLSAIYIIRKRFSGEQILK